jgi:hypothetical protein
MNKSLEERLLEMEAWTTADKKNEIISECKSSHWNSLELNESLFEYIKALVGLVRKLLETIDNQYKHIDRLIERNNDLERIVSEFRDKLH